MPLFLLNASFAQILSPASLNPKNVNFPYSSLIDFSFLLDSPAGKYGFLKVKDGHFYWENGKRAKFWGINVASLSINIDKEKINKITDVFAKAGINLVRLEAIDNRNCIISETGPTSRQFNLEYLDKADYWIYKLKEKGIYVYIDLLDFRTFKGGDGVVNADKLGRAAKPYAVFNPGLIELEKEYAEKLLTHVNPYTKLKLIDDPAICLVELFNEHGLFIKAGTWLKLAEPYNKELEAYWNDFLKEKYKNTEELEKAWGKLSKDEVLEKGTVLLPDMEKLYSNRIFSQKLADGCEFAYKVQIKYFNEMKKFLLSLGLKVPVTAAVSTEFIADTESVAETLDFTTENFYWDHPSFEKGKDWQNPYYYNNSDQLKDDSLIAFMPYTTILKWKKKPVVIREWATPWPNAYRSSSILEAVAYASLQDFDAMLLFAYRANEDIDKLRQFSYQADTPVWGLMGAASKIFLSGDIKAAKKEVNIIYDKDDLFFPAVGLSDLYKLGWISRIENVLNDNIKLNENAINIKRKSFNAHPLEFKDTVLEVLGGGYFNNDIYISDTAEIKRDINNGKIEVKTPKVLAVSGDLKEEVDMGLIKIKSASSFGTFFVISLDNKELKNSENFLVKMTTVAENTNQKFYKDPESCYPEKYKLSNRGTAPVITLGSPSPCPAEIYWKGKKILELYMQNGSFELIVSKNKWIFYCDTPGVKVNLHPGFEKAKLIKYFYDDQKAAYFDLSFTYPAYCKYVEILPL